MKPGDLLLVRGTAQLSLDIMKATGGRFSHVGIVVCSMEPHNEGDGIIIEALDRVKTRPFHLSTAAASYWEIWSNKTLTDSQRWAVVSTACDYSADSYGYINIAEQGIDALFHNDWATEHLPNFNHRPICSELAAFSYNGIGIKFSTDAKSIAPSRPAPYMGIAEFVECHEDWERSSYRIPVTPGS